MYCGSCGRYLNPGETCSCMEPDSAPVMPSQTNHIPDWAVKRAKSAVFTTKIISLALAVLCFILLFSDLYQYKRSPASRGSYEGYLDDLDKEEEEEEELRDKYYDYDETYTSGVSFYEEGDIAEIRDDLISRAISLLTWVYIAFALSLGAFAASIGGRNEKGRLIAQGLFFGLMLVVLILVLLATSTGASFGVRSGDYYKEDITVTTAWVGAFVATISGLAFTAISSVGVNNYKELEEKQ